MTNWAVVAFIVLVIALDDILHELLWSVAMTWASVLDRFKSLQQKLRARRRGAQR